MRHATPCALLSLFLAWGGPGDLLAQDPQAPEGYVLIEEEVWMLFVDEPSHHFHRAREAFLTGRPQVAADRIRKGAAFVRIEARRAGRRRASLESVASSLEELAARAVGRELDARQLDLAFASAHQTLGATYLQRATSEWNKGRRRKAAVALDGAAMHAHHAAVWSGYTPATPERDEMRRVRGLAARLREGDPLERQEIDGALEVTFDRLGKIRKHLESVGVDLANRRGPRLG